MTEPVAYVNGQWGPLAQARVPVLDRGFLLADGVYEVIPAYAGRMLRADEHLARLERSLAEVRMGNPHTRAQWLDLLGRLIRENGGGDKMVYLQVTRGAAAGRGHPFPENLPPTVVAFCQPLPLPSAEMREDGVGVIAVPDIRWSRCDIKAIALLPNLLATQAAKEQGCNEALLVRDDRITEGASSNVFAVLDGTVATPPKNNEILPGVTRDLLLELLRGAGVPVQERPLGLAELRRADEVWITSSTREVLAVARVDGQPVGAGRPGPLHARAWALFQDYKRRVLI